tara:strand:- start:63 stop:299 length:237 start_codon:yes stop_codon:yes gene_type:complete
MADTDKISLTDSPKFNKDGTANGNGRSGGADKQTSESRIFGIGKTPKIKIERLKNRGEGLYAKPNKRNKVYGETDLLE